MQQLPCVPKLYGREPEINVLVTTLEQVRQGGVKTILLFGAAGCGKTALVEHFQTSTLQPNHSFARSKFELQARAPYYAFTQALRSFILGLQSRPEEQENWSQRISTALGQNGQLLIDIIPELETLIGPQPDIPQLPPTEAKNRFKQVLQQFVRALTRPEQPLTIFLDDLHWSDPDSLDWFQWLASDANGSSLLLIGAYRQEEAQHNQALQRMLNSIEAEQLAIPLLSQAHVQEWIGERFPKHVRSETPIYQQTHGNPFKTLLVLRTLALSQQQDITGIASTGFVRTILQQMPTETQSLLKVAACLGTQFSSETLATACQRSPEQTEQRLQPARATDVIELLAQQGDYRFWHDIIRQTVYEDMTFAERAATHQQIGRALLAAANNQPALLFTSVNQLNQVKSLLPQTEQDELARLNLRAAQQAKAATAHVYALSYVTQAMELAIDTWERDREWTMTLFLEAAELEYLNQNFERSNALANEALEQTETVLEEVRVYELQMQVHIAQNEMQTVLDIGMRGLELLNILLEEEQPNISLEELANLPEMQSPEKLAALRILDLAGSAALATNPTLMIRIEFTKINLCLQYGTSKFAALVYVDYALLMCSSFMQFDLAYQLGTLALETLNDFEANELKSKVWNTFNANVRHWKRHLQETKLPLREAFYSGIDNGELLYSGYAALSYGDHSLFSGENLEIVDRKRIEILQALENLGLQYHIIYGQIGRQFNLNLLGFSNDNTRLIGEAFDEREMLPILIGQNNQPCLFYTYLAKAILNYLFGNYEEAVVNTRQASQCEAGVPGFVTVPIRNYIESLSLLAKYPQASPEERREILVLVRGNQGTMRTWAYHAPMNHQHKYDTIEAVLAWITGEQEAAEQLFQQAIEGARENGYIQEEALANEIAGKLCLKQNKYVTGQKFLEEALRLYIEWGAIAKVIHLETRYFFDSSVNSESLSNTLNQEILKFFVAQQDDPRQQLLGLCKKSYNGRERTITLKCSTNKLLTFIRAKVNSFKKPPDISIKVELGENA